MGNRPNNPGNGERSRAEAHERFLELAAVSTSGELSEEERNDLNAHLAECVDCRQALGEFEAAAQVGMPLLHEPLSSVESASLSQLRSANETRASSLLRNGPRSSGNWNYLWIPFAAALALIVAMGIYFFDVGQRKAVEVARTAPDAVDASVEALRSRIRKAEEAQEQFEAQLAERERIITVLRRDFEKQSETLDAARKTLADAQQTVQGDAVEKLRLAAERSVLAEQFSAAQASLEKTRAQLAARQQDKEDGQALAASLEAQIRDLHGQLRDREEELNKQQELLSHDRDIRELMGARDLYIAEVYDVAGDGQTRKPYGRVFYTKGKSLIFYAYDLDQQTGLKKASTFQAWGSRGLNRQQALNLGVFFEDNAAKKRWVLKFDDPKKLEQIDAVFVTVEPQGGSFRPSGKPLLFAYLKVQPNHP